MSRRLTAGLIGTLLAAAVVSCGGGSGGGPPTLTWFIFNEPSGAPQTVAERCSEQSDGRYEIKFEFLPSDADGQREQLVRRLGAEDESIDLIGMDVIWTGEFANAGWVLEVPEETEQVATEEVFDSVLETATFEERLYAAPIWSNTQVLWYRDDRVEQPPATWDEMIDQAEDIGPEEGTIQVQADFYEGLTVWATSLIASAGTEVLTGSEEIALEQGPTEEALAVMGRLSRSEVADPGITTSTEDTANTGFASGGSAFMVNYPFAFPTTEETAPDVAENMSAAKFPAVADDVESAPPLGGINLGVSAFSENPDLAFEAIECLVQPENQLEIASAGGLPPVREDLYEEPELEETYPGYADVIFDSIRDAQARPSEAPAYQDVTLAIQRSLHPTDEIDPEDPTPTYEELLEAVQQAVAREGIL